MYTFTYQKTLLHTPFLLFFKTLKALSVSLSEKTFFVAKLFKDWKDIGCGSVDLNSLLVVQVVFANLKCFLK